jgi:hypothetical protein
MKTTKMNLTALSLNEMKNVKGGTTDNNGNGQGGGNNGNGQGNGGGDGAGNPNVNPSFTGGGEERREK